MKAILSGILCIILAMAYMSCSKDPGKVLEEVKDRQNEGKYEDIKNYYTKQRGL